ncbi:putative beta-lysine N-acetyltransferase [Brevibacillus sp. H7]|uniref:putative beta-lysine N-acetyltransferase n=1 Tax=Brevibacillus sp. H7 TaxID=3349138 RepID=UPI0037FD78C1
MTDESRFTSLEDRVMDRVETGRGFEMQVRLDGVSSRIRVDDYRGSVEGMIERLEELAQQFSYTKTIVRVRAEHVDRFLSRGYEIEGVYRAYYNGSDAYAMTRYHSVERRNSDLWLKEDHILRHVLTLPESAEDRGFPPNYSLRRATKEDVEQLAALYAATFPVYPTPVSQPAYLAKLMKDGVIIHAVETDGQIVSAAAAHVNQALHHAEIADCATDAEHQKKGLMKHLILCLEKELFQQRIYCVFSHARSLSFGMNAVFHQLGYTYGGRLTRNCIIYDKYEDMSLWIKDLSDRKNTMTCLG